MPIGVSRVKAMSETNGLSGDGTTPATPSTTTPPTDDSSSSGPKDFFATKVNVVALILCAVITFAGVKVSSFLPAKLYFSFTKMINTAEKPSPFMVQPAYVEEKTLCSILDPNPNLKQIRCVKPQAQPTHNNAASSETEAKTKDSASKSDTANNADTTDTEENSDAVYEREKIIADQEVRRAAEKEEFTNSIFAFALRLVIPLIAGFITGRMFGAEGIYSGALGAATAALLLCWLVIVLWD